MAHFTEAKSDFGQHALQNVYCDIHFQIRYNFGQRVAQNLIRLQATCCTKSDMTGMALCNMLYEI